jgi:hypothetical protein
LNSNYPVDREALYAQADYKAWSVQHLFEKITDIFTRIPQVPESNFRMSSLETEGGDPHHPINEKELKTWANPFRACLEELELFLGCIGPAQLLTNDESMSDDVVRLNQELTIAQLQLSSRVKPKLIAVSIPVVITTIDRLVTEKNDSGQTIQTSFFRSIPENPAEHEYNVQFLANHAESTRQLALANLDRILRAMEAFLVAEDRSESSVSSS